MTEKLHGSSVNYFAWIEDGEIKEAVSSKGLLKKGLCIEESEDNLYWQAVRNTDLRETIKELCKFKRVRLFSLDGVRQNVSLEDCLL